MKDSGLIGDALAAVAGVDPSVMGALHDRFRAASEPGHAAEDMAAVLYGFRQDRVV